MNQKEEALPEKSDTSDHSLHPGLTNRYKIIRLLGSGGMGNVYLAQDKELNRFVAVKTIKPDLTQDAHVRKRIDIECRLHAAIGMHPNIVALYDRIELDGFVYLILEFVEGVLLSELLESDKSPLSSAGLAKKIEIILQILEGLQAIHKKNILHRDIKPSNVMVSNLHSRQLSVKLMDFGIAHADSEEIALTRLTAIDSSGPGTPTYMAPERIDPQTFGAISVATDLYSVGVILFQMLSDGPPFRGTVTEILMGHLTKPIDLSALRKDLPLCFQDVLVRSLQKKQTDRYSDAEAFADCLRNALATVQLECPPGNNRCSDQTLLATDPKLLIFNENRTLLNTKTYVEHSPKAKFRKRIMATGAALVLLIVVSLSVVKHFDVLNKKLATDQAPPSHVTESKAVDPLPANILHENDIYPPRVEQQDPVEAQEKKGEMEEVATDLPEEADSGGASADVVGSPGNDLQKEKNVGVLSKKSNSAIDAFYSARPAKVQENAEAVQNPGKTEFIKETHTENIDTKKISAPKRAVKRKSTAPNPNCRSLTESYQLGDPSITPQHLQKICEQ